MTRRERLEARAERRRSWAESRERKAETAADRAASIAQRFEGGQPILVGHHSERRARRDQERMHGAMSASVESTQMAQHHRAKAAGIERALDKSIFSDDADAIEQLGARIAEQEAKAALHLAVNRAWRSAKGSAEAFLAALREISPDGHQKIAEHVAHTMHLCPWLRQPLDTTNLRAAIRRDRERLDQLRQERAKASGKEGQS